jgi:myo-inositol catabolism protein IolH
MEHIFSVLAAAQMPAVRDHRSHVVKDGFLVLVADTYNQEKDCRYILNPPWLNGRGKSDAVVHQHLAMGEGEVDFEGIFETLRKMDFASRKLNVGGESIACVSYFGFPEKMDKQAPLARERIEKELLGK